MTAQLLPPAAITLKEAIAIQQQLRQQALTEDRLGSIKYVAGADVGFEEHYKITRAAIAVLAFPSLELVDYTITRITTCFPYIPGLLSFREVPAVIQALEQLKTIPDLILYDGQGIAHPRRLGVASHLGVLTGFPTIGVAKSRLIGTYQEPSAEKGNWQPLQDKGETIGAVLQTKLNTKPLFVSPGHKISLATAIDFTMACITRYRLPQTTRWADYLASHYDETTGSPTLSKSKKGAFPLPLGHTIFRPL